MGHPHWVGMEPRQLCAPGFCLTGSQNGGYFERVFGGHALESLDEHGQPLNSNLNQHRRIVRGVHELIGFLRGIIADGCINPAESEGLAKWLVANREIANEWPVSVLADRLAEIYERGIPGEEECEHLKELVVEIVGRQDDQTFLFTPSDLPLSKPQPEVGNKILKAVEYTQKSGIAIISEKHWESYLRMDRSSLKKAARA